VIIPTVRTVVVAAALLGAAGLAHADEAKTPVSATMILEIVSAPVQGRTSAFDEALKRPAPPAADSGAGEVLPDGSVRYGRAIVTVKNPCPPGTDHYEPPPLPGRRAVRR
jgi:hypothetical protein